MGPAKLLAQPYHKAAGGFPYGVSRQHKGTSRQHKEVSQRNKAADGEDKAVFHQKRSEKVSISRNLHLSQDFWDFTNEESSRGHDGCC